MSLWQEEEYFDDTELKEKRREEMKEFFTPEDTSDWSEFSWNEFRRMAKEGMTVEDRHLIPYVTYIPDLLETPAPTSILPSFLTGRKKKPAAAGGGSRPGTAAEAEEEEEEEVFDLDDDSTPYSFFSKRRPAHRRTKHFRKPARGFDQDSAAVYIQKLYRTRLAKRALRKVLCKVWCKKKDVTPGIYFYENTRTKEKRWVPPHLMMRFFPERKW